MPPFEHAVASATLRLEQTWENYEPRVDQLARARIIDLVNGNGVTCIGFLMPPWGEKGNREVFLMPLRDHRGETTFSL